MCFTASGLYRITSLLVACVLWQAIPPDGRGPSRADPTRPPAPRQSGRGTAPRWMVPYRVNKHVCKGALCLLVGRVAIAAASGIVLLMSLEATAQRLHNDKIFILGVFVCSHFPPTIRQSILSAPKFAEQGRDPQNGKRSGTASPSWISSVGP